MSPSELVLAGVTLGTLFSAITNFLTITTEAQNVYGVLFFLLGSVSAASFAKLLGPLAALVVVGTAVFFRTRALNALLGGAVFLMGAVLLARTVVLPVGIPIGIITAVIGAPFFLWLMRTSGAVRGGLDR